MDYFICKHDDGSHSVHKYDCSTPVATYTIKDGKCDCIAGSKRGKCKHTLFIEKWRPGYYIEQHGAILNVVPLSSLGDFADHEESN